MLLVRIDSFRFSIMYRERERVCVVFKKMLFVANK